MQSIFTPPSGRLFAVLALTILALAPDSAALAAPKHPYPEGRLWRLERPGCSLWGLH